jgi:hypothetical protein
MTLTNAELNKVIADKDQIIKAKEAELKELKAKIARIIPSTEPKAGVLLETTVNLKLVARKPGEECASWKTPPFRKLDFVLTTAGGHEITIFGGKIRKWANAQGEELIFVDYPGYTKTDKAGKKTYPEFVIDPKNQLKSAIIKAVKAGKADEAGEIPEYDAITGEMVVRPPKVNDVKLPGGELNHKFEKEMAAEEKAKNEVFGL